MSSLDNNYNILKSIAIKEYASKDSSSNTNIISYLKGLFEFEISSRRVLSHINDLKTLIGILEIRGALSPVNIDVLVCIYSSLKLNEKLLDEHKILIKEDRNCLFTKPYDENTIRPLLSSSIHSCKGTTLNYSSIARNEVPPIYSSILSEKGIQDKIDSRSSYSQDKQQENNRQKNNNSVHNIKRKQRSNSDKNGLSQKTPLISSKLESQKNALSCESGKHNNLFNLFLKYYHLSSQMFKSTEIPSCKACFSLVIILCLIDWIRGVFSFTIENCLKAIRLSIQLVEAITPAWIASMNVLQTVINLFINLILFVMWLGSKNRHTLDAHVPTIARGQYNNYE